MGKVQLMFVAVLAAAVFSAFGTELGLPLSLDCSKPDAVRKLEREIRERKHNDNLSIYLRDNVIPELPKHKFRWISISGHCSEVIDLTPLAGHTPKSLSLSYGTFSNLSSLETAKIENLTASFGAVLYADDLSRGNWSALKNLTLLAIRGKVLDLRSAARLEDLGLYDGNSDLVIRFAPQMRLRKLVICGELLPLLRSIHTRKLEKLYVFPGGTADYAPLAEAELPELISLNCYAPGRAPCRLPFMPKLKKLDLEKFPAVSLKHIRTQCPALEHLRLTGIPAVADWEELSKMPLRRLHVDTCGGAKWSLPVDPPPGCEVTGLPSFTENPYKMWSAWAVLTVLFGVWTFFRQKRMRRAPKKEEVK